MASFMATFRRLLTLAAPYRRWMALSALLGFATIGSSIGLMSTAAWIIATLKKRACSESRLFTIDDNRSNERYER